MKTKAIIIIIIAVVVVLGIVGWVIFGGKNKAFYDFAVVERGDVIEEVSATGTVKSAEEINLRFETSGTVEKIYASEGSKVKQDAPLVKLATGKLYSQFLQTQASYNEAKAKLDKLLAGATTEEIQVFERVVENAKIALADAEKKAENDLDEKYDDALVYLSNASSKVNIALADLENLEPKYFEDTSLVSTIFKDKKSVARTAFFGINGAKTVVTDTIANPTQANIDNALIVMRSAINKTKDAVDYTREAMSGPTLREKEVVTATDQTTVDTDTANINSMLTDISTAQQAIASQKVTNQTNINSDENTLNKAKDDLTEVKATPREVDIAVYKADVDKTKASMVELQQKLDDAVLKAPIDAIITKVNVKIGETVTAAGDTVISLIGLSRFEIKVDVPESDIGKVGVGNTAAITLDAFPEEIWLGRVAEIEPAETLIEGVVYYSVTVVFDNVDERIKSGMSADLTIETNKKENVLFIPYRAIVFKDSKKIVRALEEEEMREIEVETGLKGRNGEIEIVSGLKEGDRVITFIKK